MKQCKNCSTEFEPKSNVRGHEQIYCSLKCRSQAAVKRREKKLSESTFFSPSNNINEEENKIISDNRGNQQSMDRGYTREFARTSNGIGIIADNHLATIKELYEAKNETIFYKLKCESLEKELANLKIELSNLETELDEFDQDEESPEYSGMLGGVMEQFKQDPVNTINFATELIGNLFKPKK
jgi:hypothetical protein